MSASPKSLIRSQLVRALGLAMAVLVWTGAAGVLMQLSGIAAADDAHAAADGAQQAPAEEDESPALHGTITDEDGNPVTDATLELTGSQAVDNGGIQYFTTKTDENGRYRFEPVEASDDFRLQITSTAWVGLTDWRTLPQLRLTPGEDVERAFQLQRACRVFLRTIDEAGQPVANVRILAASLAAERFRGGADRARTDKLGFAVVGGLAPSETEYILATYHNDYAFAKLQLKLDDPDANVSHVLVLSKGVDVKGVAICSDGKPAAGWRVNAMPHWWRFGSSPNGALIDENGAFTLPHVTPGDYDVSVSVPLGDGMSRRENVLTGVALPVPQLELKLRMPSPGSMAAIAGTITFVGGEPKESIMASASSEDGEHRANAMIRPGAREFRITPLPPGQYTLRFDSTEIEEARIDGVTAPAEDVEVELRVAGKPRLVGQAVRAGGGEPLSGLRIRVLKTGYLRGPGYVQDPQWREIIDAQGRFEVDLVGPGVYQVVAIADGLAPTRSDDVNTDRYQGELVTLELSEGSSLSGKVVNEVGQPIDGARVIPLAHAGFAEAQRAGRITADEGSVETVDGEFTLEHLAPGQEALRVVHPDYCFALVGDVTVGEDPTTLEPIVLTRGGSVQGRVFDIAGRPEAGVTLYFQDERGYGGIGDEEAGRFATAVTDREGRFEVHRLPEQLCHVVREDPWEAWGVVRHAVLPENGVTHTLDLGGDNAVTGQLLINGTPLAHTRIQLGGDSSNFGVFKAYAQTDGEGQFAFWGPAPGRRTLYYAAPNTRNEWIKVRDVTIMPDDSELGSIDLRTATLTVHVRMLSDAIDAARVSLIQYDATWAHGDQAGVLALRTAVDDPWVFEQVPVGAYELLCGRPDNVTLRQRIDLGPDEPTPAVTVEWPPSGAALHGTVDVAALGDPGVLHTVKLWSKDQRFSTTLRLRDGAYEVRELPAGDYYLTDKDTRTAKPVIEFTLAEGEDRTLDLTADNWAPSPLGLGIVALHFLTDEGVPLPGPDVTLTGPGGTLQPHSSQEGRETFIGEPGQYTIVATFPGFERLERDVTIEPVAPDGRATGDVKHTFRLRRE
jgi:hypothetical protein